MSKKYSTIVRNRYGTIGSGEIVYVLTWHPVGPHAYEATWKGQTLKVTAGRDTLRPFRWIVHDGETLVASGAEETRGKAMGEALKAIGHPWAPAKADA